MKQILLSWFLSVVAIGGLAFGARAQTPDVLAAVKSVPDIHYPSEAFGTGLEGTVTVSVAVDEQGNVTSIGDVVGPAWVCANVARPGIIAMREMAIRAAKDAKFVPAMREGSPFASYTTLDFVFTDPNKKKEDVVGAQIGVSDAADTGATVAGGNEPPPAVRKKPLPKIISGGVLNGKASNLARPPYPPAARAVHAAGAVNVQVIIDEDGNVFSAYVVSGHPLLKAASIKAACSSTFSPTLLAGNPVRVSGVITYNFVP